MSYGSVSGVTDVLKGAVSFYGQSQQDKALADQARAGGAAAPASSGFPIIPVVIGGVVLLGAVMLLKKKGVTANPARRRRALDSSRRRRLFSKMSSAEKTNVNRLIDQDRDMSLKAFMARMKRKYE